MQSIYKIFADFTIKGPAIYGFTITQNGRQATRVGFYSETDARIAAQYFQFD